MDRTKEILSYDHLYELIVSQLLFDKREDVAQFLCFRRRRNPSPASNKLKEIVDLYCEHNPDLVGEFTSGDYLYCLIGSQLFIDDYIDVADMLIKKKLIINLISKNITIYLPSKL